jgi:Reverse transcriptase (RNA-dependent DNA polymerase)
MCKCFSRVSPISIENILPARAVKLTDNSTFVICCQRRMQHPKLSACMGVFTPTPVYSIRCFFVHGTMLNSRGSHLNTTALYLHKAFDSVNHMKLLSSLIETALPFCLTDILLISYSKLSIAVRWNGFLSQSLLVLRGVRQGSSLSPENFNVFINAFIPCIQLLKLGCN